MTRTAGFSTLAVTLALCLASPSPVSARKKSKPEAAAPDELAEKIAGWEKKEGLLDFYVDPESAEIWLELPAADEGADRGRGGRVGDYLYVEGLATGLGSNPIGLDRGQLGPSRLVTLRRLGGRLLIEQPNLGFRALSEDPDETRATRESFAPSVLWAGRIETTAPDGRGLVNLTSFLIRDAHDVVGTLDRSGQGDYSLDPERSVVDPAGCRAFPDNLVFEVVLTYAGQEPGPLVSRTAPSGREFTLGQHHSLVRLPDDGYEIREHDPRAGSFAVSFQDYAAPLGAPIEQRWIVRHRLRKTPEGPPELVYHVDRGAPEPVRTALLEGASWWADAFAEAGFPGAFKVELLPEGVDPLDVRYNVIQWVHRSTRGWSYGGGLIDPRTGEMIKGHVSLGSLRVRQDRLIFEGLLGTAKTGSGEADDPVELALARIRQLSAHEVGHTLGLAHNFAASTYADRASVMDYPAPLIEVAADGSFDVSRVYAVGVGDWDRHAIRWAYSEIEGDERKGLEAIVEEGLERGLAFLSDGDARPPGASIAGASLWDNGADAVAQLDREMEVRRVALERFGERNVAVGSPLARLEGVFATVYFRHRYQLEATVKLIGGLDYTYAVRGDGQAGARPVAPDRQRAALASVLATLDPRSLDIPDSALELILPRPFGYGPDRELFASRTAPAFDALGAAATAARLAIEGLLQPERAARLVDLHRRDPDQPSFEEVLEGLRNVLFAEPEPSRLAKLRGIVRQVATDGLIRLAADGRASPAVRARAENELLAFREALDEGGGVGVDGFFLSRKIERFLNRVADQGEWPVTALEPPPGSPIGGTSLDRRFRYQGCSVESPGPPPSALDRERARWR